MTPRTVAILAGAGCALAGPAIAGAFASDPAERTVLSLIIAGSVVVTILVLGLRAPDD